MTKKKTDPDATARSQRRIAEAVRDAIGHTSPKVIEQIDAFDKGQTAYGKDEVFGYLVTEPTLDSTIGDILVPISIEGFACQLRGGMEIRNADFFMRFWDAVEEAEARIATKREEIVRRREARAKAKPRP